MTKVQNIEVKKDDEGIRLDRWFKRHHPKVSHASVEKALRKGQIRVDGQKVKANYRLNAGDLVRVPPLVEQERKEKIVKQVDKRDIEGIQDSVIYKDKDIIVINKPAGLPVQGGVGIDISVDSLLDHLKFENSARPKLVHRLDKDTSGVLLLARSTTVAAKFSEAFRRRTIEKVYWAVVVGAPKENEGKISIPLLKKDEGSGKEKVVADAKGQKAVTYFRVLDRAATKVSFLELYPETGRTHQLRVHMKETGTPILGDGKYGGKRAFVQGLSNKMQLHARKIILPESLLGHKLEFTADVPEHIEKTFSQLEFNAKG